MSSGAAKYLVKKTKSKAGSDELETLDAAREQRYKWRAKAPGQEKLRPEDISVSSEECVTRRRNTTKAVALTKDNGPGETETLQTEAAEAIGAGLREDAETQRLESVSSFQQKVNMKIDLPHVHPEQNTSTNQPNSNSNITSFGNKQMVSKFTEAAPLASSSASLTKSEAAKQYMMPEDCKSQIWQIYVTQDELQELKEQNMETKAMCEQLHMDLQILKQKNDINDLQIQTLKCEAPSELDRSLGLFKDELEVLITEMSAGLKTEILGETRKCHEQAWRPEFVLMQKKMATFMDGTKELLKGFEQSLSAHARQLEGFSKRDLRRDQ